MMGECGAARGDQESAGKQPGSATARQYASNHDFLHRLSSIQTYGGCRSGQINSRRPLPLRLTLARNRVKSGPEQDL
jgi:hypothetical protein